MPIRPTFYFGVMTLFLRLFALALCAFALYGQNPLVMVADPFGGFYQNEQLKLELTRKGQAYTGVILLGGRSLPVKAKATAGTLAGTFASQGQIYSFQAKRSGSQLTLTTDGATHLLERALAAPAATTSPAPTATTSPAPAAITSPAPAAITPPAPAPPTVVGDWRGQNAIVRVNADGTATIGAKSHRWTLDGNVITFSGDGEPTRLPFEMVGNTWTWKFPDRQLVLTREGSANTSAAGIVGQWQGPSGAVQFNPDGTATVGGLVYRYGQTGDQLTLQGADGTFVATLQTAGDAMSWVVNGRTFGFQRVAAPAAGAVGGIMPELVGKWCQATSLSNTSGIHSRSVCLTLLADGSFAYASDSGATGQVAGGAYGTASDNNDTGTWTATPNSITSNWKKTGVRTFRLEKRNHAKTGDPMLVLDGTEFTTAYQKPPWR